MNSSRPLARLCVVAAVAVTVVAIVFQPGVAAAHEGEGEFAIETAEPTAVGARYVVRLTWVGDNHPAIDATVTATPIDPAGTAGTPVAFTAVDQDGRYQGEVPLPTPGTWVVRFTAVTPPATTEVTRDVTAPPTTTTTTPPSTTGPSDSPTTTESATPVSSSDDASDGVGGGAVFVLVVTALAVGGLLLYRGARRRPGP